ncbi:MULTISPECIES: phage head closure protein [unclassified Roseitalea]|uniref:phage head closure protein n=1 Tax=unclassified Roseitalea TaxID=2639107 RepID=UPI00273CF4EE|nr:MULTISPECIES: phage head closure protein [unclassified Roseitalea]
MNSVHIDPGRLRTHVRLERHAPVADAYGSHADAWSPVATLWGAIEAVRPDAALRAGDDEQVTDAVVTVRADPHIAPAMRLVAGTDIYTIRTVHDPDGTGRYLQCAVSQEPGA